MLTDDVLVLAFVILAFGYYSIKLLNENARRYSIVRSLKLNALVTPK